MPLTTGLGVLVSMKSSIQMSFSSRESRYFCMYRLYGSAGWEPASLISLTATVGVGVGSMICGFSVLAME